MIKEIVDRIKKIECCAEELKIKTEKKAEDLVLSAERDLEYEFFVKVKDLETKMKTKVSSVKKEIESQKLAAEFYVRDKIKHLKALALKNENEVILKVLELMVTHMDNV